MKKTISLFALVFLTSFFYGKDEPSFFTKTMAGLNTSVRELSKFIKPNPLLGKMDYEISMAYGVSDIEECSLVIEDKVIEQVTYIYTQSDNVEFQNQLNIDRVQNLKKLFPDLFENELIGWEIIEQGKGLSSKEKKDCFHGFVISYREVSKASLDDEMAYIDAVMSEGTLSPSSFSKKATHASELAHAVDEVIPEMGYFEIIWDDSVRTTMKEIPALVDSIAGLGKWSLYNIYSEEDDSTTLFIVDLGGFSGVNYSPDSTVYQVLERNKQWKNKLIIHDITGSMSPYTAQVLLWHELNFDKEEKQHFVFFNDGDMTPDAKKKAGEVGGIYQVSNKKGMEEVKKYANKAMRSGSGGDCPENNLEATLKGMDAFPDAENLIMIADNFATPRDLFLTKEVTKPIKIILCGVHGVINTKYLDLARETGGSVHTIESDILNLVRLKEGETIVIDGTMYKIDKGKFILIKRT